MSGKINIRFWRALAFTAIFSCGYFADGGIVSVSGFSNKTRTGGNGDSGVPIISPDGRYVLFASAAGNLTITKQDPPALPAPFNVFLCDRSNNITTLVSVNLAGTGGGNGDSFPTAISADGRFVLFESSASSLIAGDTNNATDVFVRDLSNGTTALVSVGSGGQPANGSSHGSVMTPDGRYVAFVSAASNLVPGDTNNIADVFVRDLVGGTTTLVSIGAMTNTNSQLLYPAVSSELPEITPDGRYVVFYSAATNLVAGVATSGEVYVRDLAAGNTLWASVNARSIFQSVTGSTNALSGGYGISQDGQYVAFEVCSNSLTGSAVRGVILRQNLQTGLTDIIHTNDTVPSISPDYLHNVSITPDGRFVAFVANLPTVSPTNNCVYLWDAQTGSNTIVSLNASNLVPANGMNGPPLVSSNGQFVTFSSTGNNLTTNAIASAYHIYVRDVVGGAAQLIDEDTNGFGVGVDTTALGAATSDGGWVAFDCSNLLTNDHYHYHNIFVRNVGMGTTDLISTNEPLLAPQRPDGFSSINQASVSSNGLFIAFYSYADDLVPNDTNNFPDVFVRDVAAGTNILVSAATNGSVGDSGSYDPAISADGRYVAFSSFANNLVAGDTNQARDVFIRDLQTGITRLVSVSSNGVDFGNADSFSPTISADGMHVLFHSKASNLVPGVFGSKIENLFFRDLQTGTTYALTVASSGTGVYSASMTPDGQFIAFIGMPNVNSSGTILYVWNSQLHALTHTNGSPGYSLTLDAFPGISISPNGQKLAYLNPLRNLLVADVIANTILAVNPAGTFLSHAGFGFSSDGHFLTYAMGTNATSQQNVYLYDLQAGTNLLISRSFASANAANTNSDSPSISPDGRFVAYRSYASNIVPDDSNGIPDLFIYDISNNATILLSVNASGSSTADDRSLKTVFSGDSQTLVFQSWASDIVTNDFNSACDIFALNLSALPLTSASSGGGTNSMSEFYAQIIPAGFLGTGPALAWPLTSGNSYQVQFKTNLTDPVWLSLPASPTFIGDIGYITDPSPSATQRFYRIVATP